MQSLWMLFAALCFSAMGVCVKLAAAHYSPAETVFYRGLVGLCVIYGVTRYHRQSLRTAHAAMHLWRGLVGTLSLALWFSAIALLPLATAMTLNNTAPVWLACLVTGAAVVARRERVNPALAIAVLVSFAGVVCVLQPHISERELVGGVLGLLSGLLSAFAYLAVRKLGSLGETDNRVVFYFSLTTTACGAIWTLITGVHAHEAVGLAELFGIGAFATMAQIALTRSYRLGNPLFTANLQYAGIVFSTVWGMALWGDWPNALGWTGMTLIIASGMVTTIAMARAGARAQATARANAGVATK